MEPITRRTFLSRAATVAAGAAFATPLQALSARAARGASAVGEGYGRLVHLGDLMLPLGFRYRVVSRQGDIMTDGNPTPGIFDGMGAFAGPNDTTILIRNHENRQRSGETDVVVPHVKRYDANPLFRGGDTKLVVGADYRVLEHFAVLGGTTHNCAGGAMPWGSWISCEEVFADGERPHGYIFEVDAFTSTPVVPLPIVGAGRLVHEAVAWHDGVLYMTEDRPDAAFYRYLPDAQPRRPGDLAGSGGSLEALRIVAAPTAATRINWPVGTWFDIDWVPVTEPNPSTNSVRHEAHDRGAAIFERQEGLHLANGRIYFDCTFAGAARSGQVWELDPRAQRLRLLYESPGPEQLKGPDNIVVTPVGHLLLCEDSDAPVYLRGLTPEGEIYDFARSTWNETEFAGACFSPDGRTLFVNQMGDRSGEFPATTYAIWGPWERILPAG